ncbi:MAG: RNA pseudouridine synthase [Gammaproteobacteria bacterium]|nr:RNA pseudouridine synthase [Gammaproteobacteria bacterium]
MLSSLNQRIIAQTEHWLAYHKPANVSLHSESGTGLVAELKQQLRLEFLAPVHRLDKVTSGVLLLAKNSAAAAELSEQFAARNVSKVYCAVTVGKPKKKQGAIVGDMVPARRGDYRLTKSLINPAHTDFYSVGFQDGLRIALLKPLTGKTHQLRVALKSIGSPILGDPRYAPKMIADRCYLHHYCLQFSFASERFDIRALPEQGDHFLQPLFREIFLEKLAALDWLAI